MLIVISLKNIEKCFLSLDIHMLTLKWGQRSSSAIIGAFLQTVFLFFSGPTTRCFLNSKKGRSLTKGLNEHVYH